MHKVTLKDRIGTGKAASAIRSAYGDVTMEDVKIPVGEMFYTDGLTFAGSDRERVQHAADDFEFYARHGYGFEPENVTARFETYRSTTVSQREALGLAQRFASIPADDQAAGLYLWGDGGVGKTHLTLSVAKQWEVESRTASTHVSGVKIKHDTYYTLLFAQRFSERAVGYMGYRTAIDDLNIAGKRCSGLFVEHLDDMFVRKKGVLLVTSNVPPDELLTSIFGTGGDRTRYAERFRTLFRVHEIKAKSARPDAGW
jgi:hypothetical protein